MKLTNAQIKGLQELKENGYFCLTRQTTYLALSRRGLIKRLFTKEAQRLLDKYSGTIMPSSAVNIIYRGMDWELTDKGELVLESI